MRSSNRPSGPGKPTHERRDLVVEREEIEEMDDAARGVADNLGRDTTRGPRQAERDAHTRGEGTSARSGTSQDRQRPRR